jgi:hypothetical protein
MAPRSFSFTSESVTEGHPDKIADQISDSVLDAVLVDDANGRVACETLITTGLVVVAGEITTDTYVDIREVVRDRIAEIGYTRRKPALANTISDGVFPSVMTARTSWWAACASEATERARRPAARPRLFIADAVITYETSGHSRSCHQATSDAETTPSWPTRTHDMSISGSRTR